MKNKKNFDWKKIQKWISKHQFEVLVAIISLLIMIVGTISIGIKAIFFVILLDIILLGIIFIKTGKIKLKNLKFKKRNFKKINFKKLSFKKKNATPKPEKKKTEEKKVKPSKTKKASKKEKKKSIFKIILITCFILGILVILGIFGFLFMIVKEAPVFDASKLYQREASIIYDKNGNIITKLGTEIREKITYEELPEVLVDAIIATEDSRYFQHNGFDLPRFLKASVGQVLGKSGAGGASTITMQVVKNNVTNEKYGMADSGITGIKRKFTDIYMSIFVLEKKYTKEQILEFYVNSYGLGAGSYGVEQACLTYFGKSAKDINLAEAAMIAGLFQAPTAYNPFVHPEAAENRRKTVLYLMHRHGYITQEEYDIAASMTIDTLLVKQEEKGSEYQGFINSVLEEVSKKTGFDPYVTPMEIYTTMDPKIQDHVNGIFMGESYKWRNDVVKAGTVIIDVKTGAVAAIGAARGTIDAKTLSYATGIKRQIGSTAKPFYDYGPGIEFNNWSTYQTFVDQPTTYSSGVPIKNSGGGYSGLISLRTALRESKNTAALQAFKQVDNVSIKNFVTGLGLSPEIEGGGVHEAHALGAYNGESPLTLAAAYAAIANGGYYIEPYTFTKIIYRDSGEIYEQKVTKTRAMSAETAYMLTDVLKSTAEISLAGRNIINGVRLGGKSGTTNFTKQTQAEHGLPSNAVNDLWVASFSTEYAIALWYGYEKIYDNKPNLPNYCAGCYNTMNGDNKYLLYEIGKGVYKDKTSLKMPSGVVKVELEKDCVNACLPSEFTPKDMRITELFKKGTEPTEVSTRFAKLNNVTNITTTFHGTANIITWNPIQTPDTINIEYLTNYFKELYKKEEDQQKYLQERLDYNTANIGTITYDIYQKNADGSLTLLGSTADNKFSVPIKTEDVEIIVKAAYTIFKDNASDGVSITIKGYTVVSAEFVLNGESSTILKIGDLFVDQGVTVTENGIDVTNTATIVKTITNSKNETIDTIPNNIIDTYTITYNITYNNQNKVFTRTVQYQE